MDTHARDMRPSEIGHNMGTRGLRAYRYKNRYYRVYEHFDSYPSGLGVSLASLIPRNPVLREEWINRIKNGLEESVAWRREKGISDSDEFETAPYLGQSPLDSGIIADDDDEEPYFSEIDDSSGWIVRDLFIEWTYVIDLDYRAFSVNGRVHFSLDNMPSFDEFQNYFESDILNLRKFPIIPEQYLASVSYWPVLDYDAETISAQYNNLQPRVLRSENWGTPSWTSLSVAQHLSVQLVKTIVSDYKWILASPDLSVEHHKILLICWQIACAAAPSHFLCPAQDSSLPQATIHANVAHDDFDYEDEEHKKVVPYHMSAENFTRVYCWFRGCLLRFAPRLDQEVLFRNEINEMVQRLTKDGRAGGIGIVMSSNQLVAVAVDGSVVRHSPLLDFHDAKGEVRDGLLLLVHLLSPTTTVNKTPWTNTSLQANHSHPILPEEIIRHILRFTDDQTYMCVLPSVSRLIRAICIARPRFGGLVLVAVNPDGTYQALSNSGPTTETRVKLVRTDDVLDQALQCTFQYHQTGRAEVDMEQLTKMSKANRGHLAWNAMVKGEGLPEMRVQVVEGVWGMVETQTAIVLGDN